jgi:hypothetical protein
VGDYVCRDGCAQTVSGHAGYGGGYMRLGKVNFCLYSLTAARICFWMSVKA